MKKGPIIVFDSGIGGLSIFRPLRSRLPKENIVYIADSAHFPYGDKSKAWLAKRFEALSKQFASLAPRLIVLACNSATTNSITLVRERVSCPVVGVEPVIKPLAHFPRALALMTAASAVSDTTMNLREKYGQHIRIYTPHNLANAIEYNDYVQVKKSLQEIKKIVRKYDIQAVGLSCTHYPLILPMFQEAMPGVTFIDPSAAVVQRVLEVLKSQVA